MLILTGPSASGKTEIAKVLISKYNLEKFITYTTREPRPGEVDGVDYYFVSLAEFSKMEKSNEFIETTYYNNNYYGSRKTDINPKKVIILDPFGVNNFKKYLKNKVVIVFLNTPENLRIERMKKRNDKIALIESRIQNDREAFSIDKYDHLDYIYANEIIDLEILAYKIYNDYINHLENLYPLF